MTAQNLLSDCQMVKQIVSYLHEQKQWPHKIHRITTMQDSFLIKLQAANLQFYYKRDSCTGLLRYVTREDFRRVLSWQKLI